MRKAISLVVLAVAAGLIAAFVAANLRANQHTTADAASPALPTPGPYAAENARAPVYMPDGTQSVTASFFPLGYGCSTLDPNKVDPYVKDYLIAHGVTNLNGPGLVKYCRKDGDGWVLGVMAPVGEAKIGRILSAPPGCTVSASGAPAESCIPSGAPLGQASQLQFELHLKDSEVH